MLQQPFLQVFWVHLLACVTIFSRPLHLLSLLILRYYLPAHDVWFFFKILLISKNSQDLSYQDQYFVVLNMNRVSRVLTWTSSTKDEISSRGMLSISISLGNSRISLVAALKDLSNAVVFSSKLKTLFMTFNPPNFSLNVFAAKNSPVCLLARDCQCLLPSRKSKSVLPAFQGQGHLSHSNAYTMR